MSRTGKQPSAPISQTRLVCRAGEMQARTGGAGSSALRVLVAVGLMHVAVSAPAEELTGTAQVIDGDSLRIGQREMRLQGIDAPEGQQVCKVKGKNWRCGQAAAETLAFLLAGKAIRCNWSQTDHYDRALVTCYRDETNINAMMVEVGMALAYRQHSMAYIEQEDIAKKTNRGLWGSEFIAPWEWRRTTVKQTSADGDCAVKGNVNSRQAKIYHVRGWRDYARVRINPAQGDRCFGSEADAQAAGFRPAKR